MGFLFSLCLTLPTVARHPASFVGLVDGCYPHLLRRGSRPYHSCYIIYRAGSLEVNHSSPALRNLRNLPERWKRRGGAALSQLSSRNSRALFISPCRGHPRLAHRRLITCIKVRRAGGGMRLIRGSDSPGSRPSCLDPTPPAHVAARCGGERHAIHTLCRVEACCEG